MAIRIDRSHLELVLPVVEVLDLPWRGARPIRLLVELAFKARIGVVGAELELDLVLLSVFFGAPLVILVWGGSDSPYGPIAPRAGDACARATAQAITPVAVPLSFQRHAPVIPADLTPCRSSIGSLSQVAVQPSLPVTDGPRRTTQRPGAVDPTALQDSTLSRRAPPQGCSAQSTTLNSRDQARVRLDDYLADFPARLSHGRPGDRGFGSMRESSSTATGIRTPVSGLRIRRPSPLDDSGEGANFSERRVRLEGVEPPRPCGHGDLNAARLPVPPQPLAGLRI